ncbi:cytochrome-c peroxidase [Flavicella sediminum]|uniref:cytochrome-c peroxidase n=1 Tax=Flavicella sediminum TaxID=2585141 RepID=UPI00111E6F02|nr:cytochrome c peroxidase [Flavicella sediminum]
MSFYKIYFSLLFGLSFSFGFGQSELKKEAEDLHEILQPYFKPVVKDVVFLEKEKHTINLGKTLFYDKRLSKSKGFSCNSCHDLKKYGTNGSHYLAQKGTSFFRDVPSIYNVHTLPIYNADGSIHSLKEKLKQSISSSHEMQMDKELLMERIGNLKGYQELFSKAYNLSENAISFENLIDALVQFISGLKTPAPIDKFIQGDLSALSSAAIEGGHVFNSKSCYSCHTGSNIGGQMLQKVGIVSDWPNQKDLGYYHIDGNPMYKMFFRVSALRNVEKTAPYFHDSSSKKLWKAIQKMGRYERGIDISVEEALKIQLFLKTLTGEIPQEYIKEPKPVIN